MKMSYFRKILPLYKVSIFPLKYVKEMSHSKAIYLYLNDMKQAKLDGLFKNSQLVVIVYHFNI